MARQTSGQGSGMGRGGDQTAMPGQVPDEIFGISIGSGNSTGAPGSSGATGSNPDDTAMAGQDTEKISGITETGTGAPGSAGASPNVATGAAWTPPFAVLDGGGPVKTGGSVDTEGHSNKYGTNTMAGVAGPGQPHGTGAGSGGVMVGGRARPVTLVKDVSGVAPWPMHAVPVREWATGSVPGYLPGTSPEELARRKRPQAMFPVRRKPVQDLSDMPLAKTSLVAGSSMAAGNTVDGGHAYKDGLAAPGSDPVDSLPPQQHQDNPNITIAVDQKVPTTLVGKGAPAFSATPLAWKKAGA